MDPPIAYFGASMGAHFLHTVAGSAWLEGVKLRDVDQTFLGKYTVRRARLALRVDSSDLRTLEAWAHRRGIDHSPSSWTWSQDARDWTLDARGSGGWGGTWIDAAWLCQYLIWTAPNEADKRLAFGELQWLEILKRVSAYLLDVCE